MDADCLGTHAGERGGCLRYPEGALEDIGRAWQHGALRGAAQSLAATGQPVHADTGAGLAAQSQARHRVDVARVTFVAKHSVVKAMQGTMLCHRDSCNLDCATDLELCRMFECRIAQTCISAFLLVLRMQYSSAFDEGHSACCSVPST